MLFSWKLHLNEKEKGIMDQSKNKPRGLYFSKVLFEGLFLEGPIFGGAYLRREICVTKSIELLL